MSFVVQPAEYMGVFNRVLYEYSPNNGAQFITTAPNIAIRTRGSFTQVVGDYLQVGGVDVIAAYKGTFKILAKAIIPPVFPATVSYTQYTLDTPNVGASPNGFWVVAGKKPFYILTGFGTLTLRDTLYVSADPNDLRYRFGVQGFLKKYFELTTPESGVDYGLSLRYRVQAALGGIILGQIKYGYYGYLNPTEDMIEDRRPLGDYPIAYTDKKGKPLPVIYSEIDGTEKSVEHFLVVNPEDAITLPATSFQLLAGQVYEITFQSVDPIVSPVFDPALPAWITILPSEANQVKLRIQTYTSMGGDYVAIDYDNVDYDTLSINDLVGCYAFTISDGVEQLFEFEFCIGAIAETQAVCPSDSLNFAYLNSSGGYNTLILPCVYEHGVNLGKETVAINSDGRKFRAEYRDVFYTYNVRAQVLSRKTLDFIEAMRLSIQVYLFNDVTMQYDIPIVIEKGNFISYGNKFNASKASAEFSFDVAKELKVQTQ